MTTNNYLRSTDLFLASTVSLYYPLDSIDMTNPKRSEFVFKRDEGLDKLVEAYWRRELKIEPQTLFTQLKFMKSRLYSDR